MKTVGQSILILAAAGAACFGQQWEFGGLAGGGFLNTVPVSSTVGTATAGFQTGAAFGGYVGFNQYKHIGGELRYTYLQSNLSLKSGGSEASFSGMSHVVGYDVIFKTTRDNGKVQLFAAVGGGMKVFRGTGTEAAYQPLSQYGYFTKTQALKPMARCRRGREGSPHQEGLPARRIPRLHHGLPDADHHSAAGRQIRHSAPRLRPDGRTRLRNVSPLSKLSRPRRAPALAAIFFAQRATSGKC